MSEQVFDTVDRARGRWQEILRAIGVENRFLSPKHGPCPLCRAGTDRFRFDDRNSNGDYFCSQCRPGIGIIFVQKFLQVDFKTACDRVDEIIGGGSKDANKAPKRQRGESNQDDDRGRKASWLWGRRQPPENSPAEVYLRCRRGYSGPIPSTLAFLPPSKPEHQSAMIARRWRCSRHPPDVAPA